MKSFFDNQDHWSGELEVFEYEGKVIIGYKHSDKITEEGRKVEIIAEVNESEELGSAKKTAKLLTALINAHREFQACIELKKYFGGKTPGPNYSKTLEILVSEFIDKLK